MAELQLFAVVALLEDLPDQDLRCGQVGTVVEQLAPRVYEVDFSDDAGLSYGSAALRADQLMPLYHKREGQAA